MENSTAEREHHQPEPGEGGISPEGRRVPVGISAVRGRLARTFLGTTGWLALTGAALANQHFLAGIGTPEVVAAVSVIVWVIQAIMTLVVFVLIEEPVSVDVRVSRALAGWFPITLLVWLLAVAVFYLGTVSAGCFIPLILVGATGLLLWRSWWSVTAWVTAFALAVVAFTCLVFPWLGKWCLGGICLVLLLVARILFGKVD